MAAIRIAYQGRLRYDLTTSGSKSASNNRASSSRLS